MPSRAEGSTSGSAARLGLAGRWLMAAYAVSGAAALAYEVGWMRELGGVLGSTAYASGTMLAAFMTGLGIGSILGSWLAKRSHYPLRDAARAELAVALFSVLALVAIVFMPGVFFDLLTRSNLSGPVFFALQFAASFTVMLLPTIAMGTTYPLIMEAVGKRSHFGQWAGRLYTANTAGAIVGSLLTGFVLIPLLRVKGALLVAAFLSFAAAVVLAWLATRMEDAPSFWRSPEPFIAGVAIVALALIPPPPPYLLSLTALNRVESSAEYRQERSNLRAIYDRDSVYSRVSVFEDSRGLRTLRNGALTEGSNGDIDILTTSLLGIVPAASAQATSSALVVGLGTGYTPAALIELAGFDSVTTVEINPAVVPALSYFAAAQVQKSPKWHLVVDDARAHILTSPERYDVITSEPSWPLSASVAPLFTREFMEAAKSRLKPGGVFCQWLPRYLLRVEDLEMMYKTMRQVYPRVDVWAVMNASGTASDLVLVGHTSEDAPSVGAVGARATQVAGSLNPPQGVLQVFSDKAGLEAALSDPSVPINTDDHSRLEYRVLWNLLSQRSQSGGGQ